MEANQQQKAVIEKEGCELLVAAAAGSGKTYVLVERLLKRILGEEQADITDFVVITFTNEAAKELKQRIAQELNKRFGENYQDRHLRRQVSLLPQARISTIHSLCISLLQEYGHEININPNFRVCSKGEAKILRDMQGEQSIETWYEAEDNDSFLSLVNTLAYGNDDSDFKSTLLHIYDKLQSHENPEKWVQEQREYWEDIENHSFAQLRWGRLCLERYLEQLILCLEELRMAEKLCHDYHEELVENYCPPPETFTFVEETIVLVEKVLQGEKTWSDLEKKLENIIFPDGKSVSKEVDQAEKEEVQKWRSTAKKRLTSFSYNEEEEKSKLLLLRERTLHLTDLVMDFSHSYQLEKEKRNWLDYGDLEHFAVKLLYDQEGNPSKLAQSQGITELMVDEYQDCNRVQNAIFYALSEEGKRLFMVGDNKQAIYRFRLADPSIFTGKYESFHHETPENKGEKGVATVLTLDKNFRSRQEVLTSCNDFFSQVMTMDFGEVNYKEDGMLQLGGTFPESPNDAYYRSSYLLLDLEKYREENPLKSLKKEYAEASFVAKKIKNMVESKFQVTDKSGALRDVAYGDFMVLLRSKNKMVPYYTKAMAEQGVPLDSHQGENIFAAVEVNVALALLQIIDNPLQDVPFLCVLQSPLFGFSAEELALLKHGQYGRFYQIFSKAEYRPEGGEALAIALQKRDEFLAFFYRARQKSREMSPQDLLWHLYESCHFLSIYGAMDKGEKRQENLLGFYQLLGEADAGGLLFTALQQVLHLQEEGEMTSPVGKTGEGQAVLLHSIHKSKGLEKPVVILGGLFRGVNLKDTRGAVLFHQKYGIGMMDYDPKKNNKIDNLPHEIIKEQLRGESYSEELRILYVAMTRAREKLILVDTLDNATEEIEKMSGKEALNGSKFKEMRSLGEIFMAYFFAEEEGAEAWDWETVVFEDGAAEVLSEGEEAVEKDFSHLIASCKEQFDWQYEHLPATWTTSKITATQTKGRKILEDEDGESIFLPVPEIDLDSTEIEKKGFVQPRQPRFAQEEAPMTAAERGTAVHAYLEFLKISPDLDCSLPHLTEVKERLLAEGKLSQRQFDVISVEKIEKFLQSSWGQGARASSCCSQECRFSLLISGTELGEESEEELLLQGVVDLWYLNEKDQIVIVDFKSDKVKKSSLAEKGEEHKNQMLVYGKALARMTGKEVASKVLWFTELGAGIDISP
ncbi:MAG: UvrD-helicase domain-containing protein [Eubacteriales bacterium]